MNHNLDHSNKILTLTFAGDVLSTNVSVLRQEVFHFLESEEASQADWQTLQLDLRAAKQIDSMGLNLLVSIIKVARSRNARVTGQIASPSVQRVLLFTRLNTQMDLVMAA